MITKSFGEMRTMKDALLRQQGNAIKSLKKLMEDVHQTLAKTVLAQKENQKQALTRFEQLIDSQTQAINVLAGMVRTVVPQASLRERLRTWCSKCTRNLRQLPTLPARTLSTPAKQCGAHLTSTTLTSHWPATTSSLQRAATTLSRL